MKYPKVKIISNYNDKGLSTSDLSIIDYINNNPKEFITTKTITQYCENKPFTPSTFHKLSVKLGYESALSMKNELTIHYMEKAKNLSEITSSISFEYKNNSLELQKYLNDYLKNLSTYLYELDWELVDKLKKSILNCKTIYAYQPDSILTYASFEILSNFLDIKIFRIESPYRLNMIKDFGLDKNSILIISKAFKQANEFEKDLFDFFYKKNIEIFTIVGLESIFPKCSNNIVIGNFKNLDDHTSKVLRFKLIYDQVINMLIYEMFLVLVDKKNKKL